MGDWANEAQDSVIVPTGATSGQRIILDGVTGKEDIYDSTGARVVRLDSSGLDVAGSDGSGAKLSVGSGAKLALTPPPIQGVSWDPGGILADSFQTAGLLGTPRTVITAPNNHAQPYQSAVYLVGASSFSTLTQIQNRADSIVFLKPGGNDGVILYPGANGSVSAYRGGAEETWHPLPLFNGWTGTAKYKLMPDGTVRHKGRLSGGAFANGTKIGAVPVAYAPPEEVKIPCAMPFDDSHLCNITVNSNGDVMIWGATTANVALDSVTYSVMA